MDFQSFSIFQTRSLEHYSRESLVLQETQDIVQFEPVVPDGIDTEEIVGELPIQHWEANTHSQGRSVGPKLVHGALAMRGRRWRWWRCSGDHGGKGRPRKGASCTAHGGEDGAVAGLDRVRSEALGGGAPWGRQWWTRLRFRAVESDGSLRERGRGRGSSATTFASAWARW